MVMVVLGCLQSIPHTLLPHQNSSSCSRSLINNNCCNNNNNNNDSNFTRRKAIIFSASLVASYIHLHKNSVPFSVDLANAQQEDELEQEEERVIHVSQETLPSVVFIKDLEIVKNAKSSDEIVPIDDEMAKVEGTGSGFIWDKFGHILDLFSYHKGVLYNISETNHWLVTNYHVVAKLATDTGGRQRCKVFLVDAKGNSFSREGKIIGFDPAYDLAVLKVDVEGNETKPVTLGTSNDLRVGQSCFAIGNPYGYENTLKTGVVSGLGREIPSPNGSAIRGAIQTDAAINAGNSGGPLIDSYGHVIGVNTATFTRKGTGVSSGVNFAIPIDTVVRTVPNLIVYGTPYRGRF